MDISSKQDTDVYIGPYRATKLWNEIIHTFRKDMPCGRHRRYMRTYDNCFVASGAVDWLLKHLRCNPNFGPEVTRCQTVQLLKKLFKSGVFEDVRPSKHGRSDFTDNGRIYRFVYKSPPRPSRPVLVPRANYLNGESKIGSSNDLAANLPEPLLQECHLVGRVLSAEEIEDVWKSLTLHRLQQTLGTIDLGEILDSSYVSGRNIHHNCLYVNKSGIVTNIEAKDQLPHWAMSAMKCLARWPEKVDDNLPSYPGFEKDVFGVVKDYFCGLAEPLMTFEMYEVITNVFVGSEDTEERTRRALRLVCLLLPPANRRRLQLLLKLMYKMCHNQELCLDRTQTTRQLLLDTFTRTILSSHEEADMDELLVRQIVSFLIDNYAEIMTAPLDLKVAVEERLKDMQKPQIVYSPGDPALSRYCTQVSMEKYESQKLSSSQKALADLLEEIIADQSMSIKDKKKRLKQFSKTYPSLYYRRFPTAESEAEVIPPKPKIKPPLLVKPLMKLRGLRL
ncbi:DEP domain-containing protein 1A-like isoform X2 [Haliotis rubra]|uniref:DEP domain-containing protein 1A-like isoform X2 n=1 Tax=Haliotis rubra TaxID=36100 RepID=UPI001EE52F13|nr:DEP domain-containing protein 1A-like isoform X2 [Haliotis rubra]